MSDTSSGTYGDAHGRTSPFRWDSSSALAVILLVAAVVLFFTGIVKIRLSGGAAVAI